MVQVEKQRRLKRLGKKKQREIIANYFVIESKPFRNSKFKTKYQIDNNEARAVQRLVLDLMGQSEVMDEWMDAIIDRYFCGQSWPEMVRQDRSRSDVLSDVKCGLALLHCRYGFVIYT